MKNLKEVVDNYLIENFADIQEKRKSKDFKWFDVAFQIAIKNNYSEFSTADGKLLLDPEYVRTRFRHLRKQEPEILEFVTSAPKVLNTAKEIMDEIEKNSKSLTQFVKFQYVSGQENKEKGTKEFNFTANNIPTEEEIIEHFNIDTNKFKISQIWHKTTPSGKYSISVNLQALKGNQTDRYRHCLSCTFETVS